MRLFHFSEDPTINRFDPRPVRVPSVRPPGGDWLNGPLVWAIDDQHQPVYLFPRDCPRILVWRTPRTTPADHAAWFGDSDFRMIAHIEAAWLRRLEQARVFRYELPPATFNSLEDAGMWVSRTGVEPIRLEIITDLPAILSECGVQLRVMDSLAPLRDAWSTSLHVSGVRLRNAVGWAN